MLERCAANTLVNGLTMEDILYFIADMKRVYDPSTPVRKGRPRSIAPRQLSLRCKVDPDGTIWLNPEAFSWTKSERKGYPTMPFRKEKFTERKTANEKAPSCTRVLVHSVLWRFHNEFQKIPQDLEVSHLTDVTAVGKPNLHVESGVMNKHRIGCHARTFPGQPCRCGIKELGVPFCLNKQKPADSCFLVGDEKAALKALPSSQCDDDDVVITAVMAPVCEDCYCPIRLDAARRTPTTGEIFTTCICRYLEVAQD